MHVLLPHFRQSGSRRSLAFVASVAVLVPFGVGVPLAVSAQAAGPDQACPWMNTSKTADQRREPPAQGQHAGSGAALAGRAGGQLPDPTTPRWLWGRGDVSRPGTLHAQGRLHRRPRLRAAAPAGHDLPRPDRPRRDVRRAARLRQGCRAGGRGVQVRQERHPGPGGLREPHPAGRAHAPSTSARTRCCPALAAATRSTASRTGNPEPAGHGRHQALRRQRAGARPPDQLVEHGRPDAAARSTTCRSRSDRQVEPRRVMCSYNQVNGVYACENPILNNVLKGDTASRASSSPTSAPSTAPHPHSPPVLDQELNAPKF